VQLSDLKQSLHGAGKLQHVRFLVVRF